MDSLWEYVEDYYWKVVHASVVPTTEFLSEGYVFDENKTVKWNKNRVAENNLRYQKEEAELIAKRDKLWAEFIEQTAKAALDISNLNRRYLPISRAVVRGLLTDLRDSVDEDSIYYEELESSRWTTFCDSDDFRETLSPASYILKNICRLNITLSDDTTEEVTKKPITRTRKKKETT